MERKALKSFVKDFGERYSEVFKINLFGKDLRGKERRRMRKQHGFKQFV